MRIARWLPAVVALLLSAGPGLALALPQQQGSVYLLNQADGQWDGPGEAQGGSNTGASVVGLGDVFHDGRAALAIGAPEADPGGRLSAGSVYVVAGQAGTGAVDLTALDGRGYRIDGGSAGDELGFSLAAIALPGGHPGLAIGAPYATPSQRAQAGLVYIIDLTKLRGNVDLSLAPLPRAVVGVLTGPGACAESGYALAPGPVPAPRSRGGALVIGAPGVDPAGCPATQPGGTAGGNTGAVYVLGAGSLTRRIDLAHPGRAAATFVGVASGDRTGAAVAGVPGTNMFMIGAPYASPLGRAGAGAVYLLSGTRAGRAISLASPPAGSSTIAGAVPNDALGFAMTSTYRFLRGQRARALDLVLAAPQASPKGRTEAGEVYVVPAPRRAARIDLAAARAGMIQGANAGDEAGYALAGVGSLNGSGIPSVAIGAPFVNSQTGQGRIDSGAAYVLYGGVGAAGIDLARLRNRGFVAFGARNSDEAGTSVAGILGERGDGRPALLVGAPFAEDAFGSSPTEGGAVYAVTGWGTPVLRYRHGVLNARIGRRIPALSPVVHRTGRATFSVSPALPAGLKLGRSSGRISGTPRRLSPLTRYTVEMSDDAGVASAVLIVSVRR